MKKSTAVILMVVLGVGGLFVASIAACGGFLFMTYKGLDKDVSPQVDQLFTAIQTETTDQAYDSLTAPAFRQATSKPQFRQNGAQIRAKYGELQSKSLTSFNMHSGTGGTTAQVSHKATFEKGGTTIHTAWQKTGGQWRLLKLRVE